MSIVAWVALGLFAGFLASRVVNQGGRGVVFDGLLGALGALIGGLVFSSVGPIGSSGYSVWSVFVAVMGAIIVLVVYHAMVGRRITNL